MAEGRKGRRETASAAALMATTVASLIFLSGISMVEARPWWLAKVIGLAVCRPPMTTCRAGEDGVAGQCVSLLSSSEHCGACNASCPLGHGCCMGRCLELQSDSNNCGACGRSCSYESGVLGRVCSQGQCVCPEGQQPCYDLPDQKPLCSVSCPSHPRVCRSSPATLPPQLASIKSVDMKRAILSSRNAAFTYTVVLRNPKLSTSISTPSSSSSASTPTPDKQYSATGRSTSDHLNIEHLRTEQRQQQEAGRVQALAQAGTAAAAASAIADSAAAYIFNPGDEYVSIFSVQVPDTIRPDLILSSAGPGGEQATLITDTTGAQFLRWIYLSPPRESSDIATFTVTMRSRYPQAPGAVTIKTSKGQQGSLTLCTPGY